MKISKLLIVSGLVFGFGQQAHAAGFALIENSASGMGNAYAGAAAVAEDGSTIWFNPAGMTRLKERSFIGAGHIISVKTKYADRGSSINPLFTGNTVTPGSLQGPDDSPSELAIVPNMYYVHPFTDDIVFGLGFTVPFGLTTEYEDDWVGRYHGLLSAVSTINLNPSMAYQFSPQVSFGVGINLQYIEAELSNAIDSSAVCLKLANGDLAFIANNCAVNGLTSPGQSAADSKGSLKGDDFSFGYNFGILYETEKGSRLGFSYRSAVDHNLEGDVDFTVNPGLQNVLTSLAQANSPAGNLFQDTGIKAGIDMPASASVSAVFDPIDRLKILVDVTWTQWKNFEELRIKFDNVVQADSVTEERWENVMRYSIGANYQMNDKLVLRTGIALDQEAIPDAQHRTPRIPGNDRTWLSFGAGYQLSPRLYFDVGYAHLFVDDAVTDHTDSNGYTIRGEYEASVNIVSAQVNWTF